MTAYTQRQHLKYAAPQLFDLVADVERYPEFLPWVIASHIRCRHDHTILVDMTIAAGPLRKRFSTAGVLPHRIDIGSSDALFERFEQRWIFDRLLRAAPTSNITSTSNFAHAFCRC